MALKINGFCAEQTGRKYFAPPYESKGKIAAPRKSLVQIHFPDKSMALTYYNDSFDLKVGDQVYVEGKLEGKLGRVVDITYNFKIKVSDYRKVIAVVDTDVHGQFYMAGSHFVTFDPAALPAEQAVLWFQAPAREEEEIISNSDDSFFRLDDLNGMHINAAVAERGHHYYLENRVRYICVDGCKGFAIVEGNEGYAIEFEYRSGEISHLVCDCPCGYTCKHEFAAMLQLRETLELIEKHYAEAYAQSGYFAAVTKGTLFSFAIDGKETGSFTL